VQRQAFHQGGQCTGLDGSICVDDDIVLGIVYLEIMRLFLRRGSIELRSLLKRLLCLSDPVTERSTSINKKKLAKMLGEDEFGELDSNPDPLLR
jgi:hypothetical protein